MTKSFDELRKRIAELEKISRKLEFAYPAEEAPLTIDISALSYDDLLNELDKLYKVKAAKKYLTHP